MVLFIPQGIRTGKLGVDMEFQWYPGHMTKAKRQMQEDIKTDRSGDRTGGCKDSPEQPQSGYRRTGQAEGKTDLAE